MNWVDAMSRRTACPSQDVDDLFHFQVKRRVYGDLGASQRYTMVPEQYRHTSQTAHMMWSA
jgi:hypothetical protein